MRPVAAVFDEVLASRSQVFFLAAETVPGEQLGSHAFVFGFPLVGRPDAPVHFSGDGVRDIAHRALIEGLRRGHLDNGEAEAVKRRSAAGVGIDAVGPRMKLRALVFDAKIVLGPEKIRNEKRLPRCSLRV